MTENVKFVKLPGLQVASALGYGEQPETPAWQKLLSWMRAHQLLGNLANHRFFGFNNPNPSPGSPNYGYEQWGTVPDHVQADGDIKVFDFPGGFFATMECQLTNIGETWGELVNWQAGSKYRMAPGQCLEECLTPELLIDVSDGTPLTIENVGKTRFRLYLPLIEAS
jgi:DNA gyrase inhibitor GyrI